MGGVIIYTTLDFKDLFNVIYYYWKHILCHRFFKQIIVDGYTNINTLSVQQLILF